MKTQTQPNLRTAFEISEPREQVPASMICNGAAACILIAAAIGPRDIQSIVLAAGLLVVVPLAWDVLRAAAGPSIVPRPPHAINFLAATTAAVALFLKPGAIAAAFAIPWLVIALTCAATSVVRLLKSGRPSSVPSAAVAAVLFLAIGGLWMFATCAGLAPLGFAEPMVRLTAIHFHYAGFAFLAIAARIARWYGHRAVDAATIAAIVGVPLVAAGIATRSLTLELAATLFLAPVACVFAVLQIFAAIRTKVPATISLAGISSLSLITAMALAIVYAAGRFSGSEMLDIPQMIATHGVLNSAGFALCGLCSWRLVDGKPIPRAK
jgi:hypothetical protein